MSTVTITNVLKHNFLVQQLQNVIRTHNNHIMVYKLFNHTEHRAESRGSSICWLYIAAGNSSLIVAILRRKPALQYIKMLWSNQDKHLFPRLSSQTIIRGVQTPRSCNRRSRMKIWQKWKDREHKGKQPKARPDCKILTGIMQNTCFSSM